MNLVWQFLITLGTLVLLNQGAALIFIWLRTRVTVFDWPIAVGLLASIVGVPSRLWSINPWLLALIPVAVALSWAQSKVVLTKRQAGDPLPGAFLLNRPSPGTVNLLTGKRGAHLTEPSSTSIR